MYASRGSSASLHVSSFATTSLHVPYPPVQGHSSALPFIIATIIARTICVCVYVYARVRVCACTCMCVYARVYRMCARVYVRACTYVRHPAYILLQVKAGDKMTSINGVPLSGMPPPFVTRLLIGAVLTLYLSLSLCVCVCVCVSLSLTHTLCGG